MTMNGQVDVLGGGSPRMLDAIKAAGLFDSSNRLLIDIADAACYPGTGELLTDLSFGGAQDMSNGATTGVDTTNQVFNGVAGDYSKNTFFETTDATTGDTSSQCQRTNPGSDEAFIVNGHKNNAQWTFAGWFQTPKTSEQIFFATSVIFWTNDPGFAIAASGGSGGLYVWANNPTSQGAVYGGVACPRDTNWKFIAATCNEAGAIGTSKVMVDGTIASHSAVLNWTNTSSPYTKLTVGANGEVHFGGGAGFRENCYFGWNRAFSDAELLALYNATRNARFA